VLLKTRRDGDEEDKESDGVVPKSDVKMTATSVLLFYLVAVVLTSDLGPSVPFSPSIFLIQNEGLLPLILYREMGW